MRHGFLVSFLVISLIIISFNTSYAETVNYIYDELNRLIRVEYADGTKIIYTYDQVGNRSQVSAGIYTLAVDVVGSGTVTKNPDQLVYSPGTSVTLTAVNGSEIFNEWSGDLTGNTSPTTIIMNGNKSVTATFVPRADWLQGWTYRKAVNLSRASGAITNYQMKLLVGESSGASGETVDCNGHVQADFDDLRFTTADGITLLDYWIESITGTTPNQLATVWIEIDSIGTDATTFYMYYGKTDATAYSNFDNTFIFGDTFLSTSLDTSRWPSTVGSPTYTINPTSKYIEITNMGTKTWNDATHGFVGKAVTLPSEYKVEACYGNDLGVALWFNNTYNSLAGLGLRLETSGNALIARFSLIDGMGSYAYFNAYLTVGATGWYTPGTVNEPAFYYAKWRKTGGNIILDSSPDNSGFTERVNAANSDTPHHFRLNVFGYPGRTLTVGRAYAFKVRAFASPEPAWGSWGAEEAN